MPGKCTHPLILHTPSKRYEVFKTKQRHPQGHEVYFATLDKVLVELKKTLHNHFTGCVILK